MVGRVHADYRRPHDQREHVLHLAAIDDIRPSTDWRITPLPSGDDDIAAAAPSVGTVYDHPNSC